MARLPDRATYRGMVLYLMAGLYLAAGLLSGCGERTPEESQAPGGGMQAVPVQVRVVRPQAVPVWVEAVGQTEGQREVEVRARVGGILERRLYREGEWVEADQPLFQIDRNPYEIALARAEAALAQQQASLAQARREARRLSELIERGAVSQRDYDTARSEAELAEAAVQAAEAEVREAQLNLSYTTVRAPVAGVSDRAYPSEGTLIDTAGDAGLLTRIFQIDPIRVRFSLAPSELAKVPGGQLRPGSVEKVRLVLPDGSLYAEEGRLDFSASAIDPELGTVQFRAEFDNDQRQLLPGQFVRVRMRVGQLRDVYLVPQHAVMQAAEGHFVFVVAPPGSGAEAAARPEGNRSENPPAAGGNESGAPPEANGQVAVRPVRVGDWQGQDWIVLEGLRPGDQVVLTNLIKLRPDMPVIAQPEPAAQGGTATGDAS